MNEIYNEKALEFVKSLLLQEGFCVNTPKLLNFKHCLQLTTSTGTLQYACVFFRPTFGICCTFSQNTFQQISELRARITKKLWLYVVSPHSKLIMRAAFSEINKNIQTVTAKDGSVFYSAPADSFEKVRELSTDDIHYLEDGEPDKIEQEPPFVPAKTHFFAWLEDSVPQIELRKDKSLIAPNNTLIDIYVAPDNRRFVVGSQIFKAAAIVSVFAGKNETSSKAFAPLKKFICASKLANHNTAFIDVTAVPDALENVRDIVKDKFSYPVRGKQYKWIFDESLRLKKFWLENVLKNPAPSTHKTAQPNLFDSSDEPPNSKAVPLYLTSSEADKILTVFQRNCRYMQAAEAMECALSDFSLMTNKDSSLIKKILDAFAGTLKEDLN